MAARRVIYRPPTMMVNDSRTDDTPRTRLARLGLDALSDAEVLALALGRGRGEAEDAARAMDLLAAHDGLRGLLRAGLGALARDLGDLRAVRLAASMELGRRALAVPLGRGVPYGSSRDVARAYGPRMAEATEESVLVLVLDARQRPAAERVIARGTASSCTVGVREVFALAVREGGAGIVLVHNHPSGDPTPSPEDLTLTRALAAAGQLLDVPLIDHVIVAREGTFSFLDAGLLRDPSTGRP